MSHRFRYLFLALLAFGLVAGPALAMEKVRIIVKAKASVKQDIVRLMDIAALEGGDPELAESLRYLEVASAPPLGQERVIRSDSLRRRLKQQRVNLESLEIKAPPFIRLSRDAQEISEDFIKRLLVKYMETHLPWKRERGRFSIVSIRLSGKRLIPEGNATYEVVPPRRLNLVGRATFRVLVRVDGNLATRLWAVLDVEVLAPVVVAVRTLPKGHVLQTQDVAIQEVRLGTLTQEPFEDISKVVGKQLARRVNQGEPIMQNRVADALVIKKGALVTIIAERGLLRVTVPGVALENGEKGKIIRVRNLNSLKTIFARVSDASTVRVDI